MSKSKFIAATFAALALMGFVVVFLGTLAGNAAAASGTATASSNSWKVVKSKSARGQFAVTAISATIKYPKPKGIAVRLSGHGVSGMGVVACSRGFTVTSNSRSFSRAGLFVLPSMRGADSCDVTASIAGSGSVSVRILRRR
jgi:hypothetical protein